MSQQAQAENHQQRGLEDWGEIQGEVVALQAKFEAGELSDDALASELAALNERADAAERHFKAAASLNTLRHRSEGLAARAREPAWSRPLAEDPDGDSAASPEAAESLAANRDEDMEPGGTARMLLNQYLRREKDGGGRQALSAGGWEYLTKRRPRPRSELLSAARGEQLALTPYVDVAGGYVQAEEVFNQIVMIRDRALGLDTRVTRHNISGVRLTVPTMKVEITFEKRSRKTGATATTLDLNKILGRTSLTVNKKDALLKIPEEFFEDPEFDAVGEIARAAERDSREEDEIDIITGTGSGEPLGLIPSLQALFDAGATQVAVTPAGGGSEVSVDEVESFDTFLHSNALLGAIYLMNRIGVRKVRLMRTDVGGSGTGDFIFKRSNTAGGLNTLLEREILVSEFLPDTITSGSTGDVMWMLGDLKDYWWVVQKDLRLRVLEELFAQEHMVGYQWQKSRDGSLVRGDAFLYMRRGA